MMKKRICALITAAALMVCMGACGENEKRAEESAGTNQAEAGGTDLVTDNVNEEPEDNAGAGAADDVSSLLPNVYHVPTGDLYLNVPDYPETERSYTEMFAVDGQKYVALTTLYHDFYFETVSYDPATADAKAAFDATYEAFHGFISDYSVINGVNIATDEVLTINGVETYHFEGTFNCEENSPYDAYATGYAFIWNGYPCSIIGSVIDRSQSDELIEEIRNVVDAMILTVRAEE